MKDLAIALENRPGALAEMGEALGRAGVSIEGGGAFLVDGRGIAHFLFEDGAAARRALEAAGIRVIEEREVLVQRLNQEEPGQLGKLSRKMAEAGVNIEVLYSDHDHRLILVVDDVAAGRAVSEAWAWRASRAGGGSPVTPKTLYLLLCVLGTVVPYSQLIPFFSEYGADFRLLLEQSFSSRVGTFFVLDVVVSSVVLWVLVLVEGRRAGLRHGWAPIAANLAVGVSLGLPLFLYMREVALERSAVNPAGGA